MEQSAPLAPLPPLFVPFSAPVPVVDVGAAADEELVVTIIVGGEVVASTAAKLVEFTPAPAPAVVVATSVAKDVGTGSTTVALLDGTGAAEGTVPGCVATPLVGAGAAPEPS